MDFGSALHELKDGKRVARSAWRDAWLHLQVPDAKSKMTLPYVYHRTAQGNLLPYTFSNPDVLAEDWRVVESKS